MSTNTNDDILSKLSEDTADLRCEMRTSMQCIPDKVDSSNKIMSDIKQQLTLLRTENEELRAKNSSLAMTYGSGRM